MENLSSLLRTIDSLKEPTFSLIRSVLKALRKSKVRRPDLIVKYGPKLLKGGGLSDVEVFGYYENIFTSALDHGDYETANKYLEILVDKFPKSSRVKRLLGMIQEAQGDYSGALSIYDEILTETPTNLLVLKRKVSVHRAQGNMKLSVESLHEIVKLYPSDTSSWLELAEIHLSLCDYQSAAFCMEEVIILNPTTANYHTRLAEILYTIADITSLIKSRKHFSISLTLTSPKCNTRALYGILMTCRLLLVQKKLPPNEEEISKEFIAWAQEKLEERRSPASQSNDGELISKVLQGVMARTSNQIGDLD